MPESAVVRGWAPLQFFAVRAIGLYFLAYYLEGQVGERALPGVLAVVGKVSAPLDWLTHSLVPWVGAHLFGMRDLVGGGDGSREWVEAFSYAVMAVTVAALWTAIRPRSRHPERGHAWVRAFIRYPLAFTVIEYGVMKFTRVQFGTQPFQQLMTPLGEFSPPALMWAFMTASFPYRIFAGTAEVLGGALLLSRRTTTLGALIVLAAMGNVLAMNLAYDVGVKLLAGHLVLMSIILLTPALPRLADILVLNRGIAPQSPTPLLDHPRVARWLGLAAAVYAVYAVGTVVSDNVSLGARVHGGPYSPLAGIYDVQSLTRNGRLVTDAADSTRWNRVAIETTGFLTIQLPGDRVQSFMTLADSTGRRLTLIRPRGSLDPRFNYRNYYVPLTKELIDAVPVDDTTRRFTLALNEPDRSHVRLSGRFQGDSIDVVLRRFDEGHLLLLNWGGTHLVVSRTASSNTTWVVAPYSGWPLDSALPPRH